MPATKADSMTAPHLTEITVALIDDHDVVHEGLASWCAGATPPPIEVAGRYLRPTEFLRDRADGQGAPIDAVVLDLQFGGRIAATCLGHGEHSHRRRIPGHHLFDAQ